jgi:mono/diheme cytochrome c family protein
MSPYTNTLVLTCALTFMACVAVRGQTADGNKPSPGPATNARAGYRLFDHNCAHCHGDDAHGDEGPDLYNLKKSDARLDKIIRNGIKGEMPSFGKKFSDADVQALITYLRTLKDK